MRKERKSSGSGSPEFTYHSYVSFEYNSRMSGFRVHSLTWNYGLCLAYAGHDWHVFKKIFYLFIFPESGRDKEREVEKHQCVRETSIGCLLAHNPGMCPEWESNRRPFGSQASVQSTEPHQPGQHVSIYQKNASEKVRDSHEKLQ